MGQSKTLSKGKPFNSHKSTSSRVGELKSLSLEYREREGLLPQFLVVVLLTGSPRWILLFQISCGSTKPPLTQQPYSPASFLWLPATSKPLDCFWKFWKTKALTSLFMGFPTQSALLDQPVAVVQSDSVLQRMDALWETASFTHRYSDPITTAFCVALDAKSPSMVCSLLFQTLKRHVKTGFPPKASS